MPASSGPFRRTGSPSSSPRHAELNHVRIDDALEHVQRVAEQYSGRVDHAQAGWRSATLELVRPSVPPAPGERLELAGLWTRLTEAAENHDPSPLTTLCAKWAAELEILILMAAEKDPRFNRAAARWVGRLLVETPPMTLKEVRWVVAMVEQLPACRECLHRLARRP